MKKDPKIFLKHILDSIEAIESFSKKVSEKELEDNRMKRNAIIREIEIIGEAVKNLPMDFRKINPQIEWTKIAGMRDKLIHHYFGIDLSIILYIIQKEIPILKEKILKLIKE